MKLKNLMKRITHLLNQSVFKFYLLLFIKNELLSLENFSISKKYTAFQQNFVKIFLQYKNFTLSWKQYKSLNRNIVYF